MTSTGTSTGRGGRRRSIVVAIGAVLIALALAAASSALAQTSPTIVRAITFNVPPFVIDQGGKPAGFSIELWEAIAQRMNVKTTYRNVAEPGPGFDALLAKQADLSVAPVFITEERDRQFDFSHPIMEAGQQIMVRGAGEIGSPNPLLDMLRLLFSRTSVVWLGIALVLLLIPAHVVWLLERRYKEGILPTQKYFPGILHAAYWSASTLLTQAETMPRQPLARAIAIFWMFTGVVFVALYTAQLTTTLTVQEIRGTINGPEDLPGKRVGTVAASVSAAYLRAHSVKVQEFARLDDMYKALIDEKVDALVFSAPSLRYYAAHEGKGLVRLVGSEFGKGQLGFIFPDGSTLRKQVDIALEAVREDGTYQRIYEKWFGSAE